MRVVGVLLAFFLAVNASVASAQERYYAYAVVPTPQSAAAASRRPERPEGIRRRMWRGNPGGKPASITSSSKSRT
jgi:hypothetical protein